MVWHVNDNVFVHFVNSNWIILTTNYQDYIGTYLVDDIVVDADGTHEAKEMEAVLVEAIWRIVIGFVVAVNGIYDGSIVVNVHLDVRMVDFEDEVHF